MAVFTSLLAARYTAACISPARKHSPEKQPMSHQNIKGGSSEDALTAVVSRDESMQLNPSGRKAASVRREEGLQNSASRSPSPPRISVVIPAYQAADCIHHALDSVFAQTCPAYEVIVVNDGSPDSEMLKVALRPYDGRIVYREQENRGPSAARNLGVVTARGDFVAFLDSDDIWMPHHLEHQTALLKKDPSLGLVYADSILVKGDVPVARAFKLEPQAWPVTIENLLAEKCTVGTSSTVASRQALIDAGLFDERFRRCEDFDLWVRMRFQGVRMGYDRDVHLYRYVSGSGLSGDPVTMKRSRVEVYENIAATLPLTPEQNKLVRRLISETEAYCQVDLAKKFILAQDYDRALDAVRRARLVLNPWKLRLASFGLPKAPKIFHYGVCLQNSFFEFRKRIRRLGLARLPKPPGPEYARAK